MGKRGWGRGGGLQEGSASSLKHLRGMRSRAGDDRRQGERLVLDILFGVV